MNKNLLNNFNNNTLNFDKNRYPFDSWVLNVIKEDYPLLDTLENTHLFVLPIDLAQITDKVQKSFGSYEVSKLFDEFAEEYIAPLIESEYLIKRYATLNLVVPNQFELGRKLYFHQGIFYANGVGQGTIWTALTKCYDSNSMWVVDRNNSKHITSVALENNLSQEDFESMILDVAYPVNIETGQAHLFHQEILHGNINNITNSTRMSIDWHILLKGEEYNQRVPGGFFRMANDYNHTDISLKDPIIYISNNSSYDKNIPTQMQASYILSFLEKNNVKHVSRAWENEGLTHLPIFRDLISKTQDIVVLSIYTLTDDDLIDKIMDSGLKVYFVNEMLILPDDYKKIKYYKSFGKAT
jgi:hypothetical protein